jgi:tetratricopeptide (TPR) repeat protein
VAYFDLVVEFYKKALELNPEEYSANHNLAINLYNRGVFKIRKINHNTEIFELISIQEECVIYFKRSLPWMLKANELNENREETVKGILAIYRSLSNEEQAMFYEDQLELILKNGGE